MVSFDSLSIKKRLDYIQSLSDSYIRLSESEGFLTLETKKMKIVVSDYKPTREGWDSREIKKILLSRFGFSLYNYVKTKELEILVLDLQDPTQETVEDIFSTEEE